MANLFIDGFDLYPIGRVDVATGNPWSLTFGGTGGSDAVLPVVSTVSPLSGSRSLDTVHLNPTNTANTFGYVFLNVAPLAEPIIGFAMRINQISVSTTTTLKNYVYLQGIGMRLDFTDGIIRAYRATQQQANDTLIAAGTTNLPVGSRVYIELVLTQTTYAIYLNGSLEMGGAWAALGSLSQIQIGKTVTGGSVAATQGGYSFDDIYLNDTTGAENNSRWGDTVVVTMLPNGDGGTTEWTPVGAATGWEATDNVPPDPAIYIESLLAADTEILDVAPLPPNVFQIFTAYTAMRAMKTIAGATEVAAGIIQSAVVDAGTPVPVNQTTYTWHFEQFVHDPSTGVAWNPSTMNPQLNLVRTV